MLKTLFFTNSLSRAEFFCCTFFQVSDVLSSFMLLTPNIAEPLNNQSINNIMHTR